MYQITTSLFDGSLNYKQDLTLEDAESCQKLCQSEARCEAFSFNLETSNCSLSNWPLTAMGTALVANGGSNGYYASGPAFCPKDYTEMDVNPDGFAVTYSTRKESIVNPYVLEVRYLMWALSIIYCPNRTPRMAQIIFSTVIA